MPPSEYRAFPWPPMTAYGKIKIIGLLLLLAAVVAVVIAAADSGSRYLNPTEEAQEALDHLATAATADEMSAAFSHLLFFIEEEGMEDLVHDTAPLTCEKMWNLHRRIEERIAIEELDYESYTDLVEPLQWRILNMCPSPRPEDTLQEPDKTSRAPPTAPPTAGFPFDKGIY